MTGINSSRFWVISLAVSGSMAIFIFVVWHAAITQSAPDELPVISAPTGPARVAPELPGGMEVPNQKMTVFETFQEDPLQPSDFASPENKEVSAIKEREPLSGTQEEVVAANKTDVAGGGAEPKSSSLDPQEKAGPDDLFVMAQLGSFGSLEGAEQGWEYLRGRQGDIIGGLTPVISKVDLGEVGTFYRLRTKIMGGRQKAEKFCEVMLKSSIDCMLVEP